MTTGMALSVVAIVLGVSMAWGIALWFIVTGYQKMLRILLESNGELARGTWADRVAAKSPGQSVPALMEAAKASPAPSNPFANARQPLSDQELMENWG